MGGYLIEPEDWVDLCPASSKGLEFKYLRVLFINEEEMEQEIERRISVGFAHVSVFGEEGRKS